MLEKIRIQTEVLAIEHPDLFEVLNNIDNKHTRVRIFKNAADQYFKALNNGISLPINSVDKLNFQRENVSPVLQSNTDVDRMQKIQSTIGDNNHSSISKNSNQSEMDSVLTSSNSFDRWA